MKAHLLKFIKCRKKVIIIENITLGQILTTLTFIGLFIGSILTIIKYFKNVIDKILKPTTDEINNLSLTLKEEMTQLKEEVNEKLDNIDENQCKNYLVRSLADLERGVKLDEVEIKRMYDAYDHYCNDLKGNSYIHSKWDKVMGRR